jgi:kinesin family protein 2/24
MIADNTPKIRVVIRKRPVNKKELQKGDTDIIEVNNPNVIVKETK